MLRWFSPSYSAGGANIKAIPYVTAYSTIVTPLSSAAEVIEMVKKDLLEAKVCFDEDREIDDYEMNEVYAFRTKGRFTPYAVLATLARAYQWEGNLSEAKVYEIGRAHV